MRTIENNRKRKKYPRRSQQSSSSQQMEQAIGRRRRRRREESTKEEEIAGQRKAGDAIDSLALFYRGEFATTVEGGLRGGRAVSSALRRSTCLTLYPCLKHVVTSPYHTFTNPPRPVLLMLLNPSRILTRVKYPITDLTVRSIIESTSHYIK